jgi:hypothetical protein
MFKKDVQGAPLRERFPLLKKSWRWNADRALPMINVHEQ